ncbi:MAG TPA: UDP-N-acetylmuramoyl-L-alanyl-D-glutamate--2,6-diaminopimelate ligase [Rhabdochlamydiaceae bacterium]|nr:UDP-N-acetylmuramoyl-L-alanyl-D-glutamate--2,6-diaminopimelate ligase [Rhabdochlamydiaceae bacterium]
MKLKQLFKDIEVVWKGSKETDIAFITANSKNVAPGALFFAKRGKTGDGHRFIAEAVSAGAVAILTDTYDPFLAVQQIIHPDVNSLESLLAKRFYQDPAEKLSIFGVTGTSGKTTTTFLMKYLLEEQALCGLIGTVSWMTGKKVLPASYTTPDLLTLVQLFHEMKEEGCKTAIMEVSSHAIDQDRVKDIHFAAAVFTNLSQDHLDYHHTMEEYAEVKSRLFTDLKGVAIINGDDLWSSTMVRKCSAKIIRYGLKADFELYASHLQLSSQGMTFDVRWKQETVTLKTVLIGRFNVYNILAATALALTQGMTLQQIAKKLESFSGVPGRLERVVNQKNLQVFVDYSHKPDALKNVLQTLAELKKGRLITVFGCGGNRDVQKRPQMAAISESFSDLTIVTNDNPRNEDPTEIARQIIGGFQKNSYLVELDRKKAILKALELEKPDDIILIAGKGHETYQIFAHQTLVFDDRQVVQEACSR